jgi:hypothetical protein
MSEIVTMTTTRRRHRRAAGALVLGAAVPFGIGIEATLLLAAVASIVIGIGLICIHAVVATPSLAARHARRAAEKARVRLRMEQVKQLEAAGIPVDTFVQLAAIVDDRRSDPDRAELDALLERYVKVSIAMGSCAGALSRLDRRELEARLRLARAKQRREADVVERRLAHADRLAAGLQRLQIASAELEDVIRYRGELATDVDLQFLGDDDPVDAALEHCDARDDVERIVAPGRRELPARGG